MKRVVLTRIVNAPSIKMQYSPIFSFLLILISLLMRPKGRAKTGEVVLDAKRRRLHNSWVDVLISSVDIPTAQFMYEAVSCTETLQASGSSDLSHLVSGLRIATYESKGQHTSLWKYSDHTRTCLCIPRT